MGQALIDLCIITFVVTTLFATLGAFEFVLEALEKAGRRLRGLPVHDGDD